MSVGSVIATDGLTGNALCIATGGYACLAQAVSAYRAVIRGGPDATDAAAVRRRPSRYDEWGEWDEEDERDLQLALERLAEQQSTQALQVAIEDKSLEEPRPPISRERQAAELKPVVQQLQVERGLTRKKAIEALTTGVESELIVAHREQLITDDELLVLLLTIM